MLLVWDEGVEAESLLWGFVYGDEEELNGEEEEATEDGPRL